MTIPEKTIFKDLDSEDEIFYNPIINLEWTVTPIETEIMKVAKFLLTNSDYIGLGYPAANSDSRKNLQLLIEADDVPTDEQLKAAIGAFYNENNVSLPVSDHYYKVAGINTGGKRLYLSCQNDSIILIPNENEATSFLMKKKTENSFTMQTRGKYLQMLKPKSRNLGESESFLQLVKLSVANSDSVQTFGKFVLMDEVDGNLPVLLDYLNETFVTSTSKPLPLFTSEESSAFPDFGGFNISEAATRLNPR